MTEPNVQRKSVNLLPELTLSGTPYEIGYQHGSVFRRQIRDFLNDHLARINLLRSSQLSKDEALSTAAQYAEWIETYVPEIAQEIRGLAAGADIRYEEAVLLQIRRELIRHNSDSGDCTSVGLVGENGEIALAQTVDLAANMEEIACLLRVVPSNPSDPQICMFTFMGLCGYLGMNSSGLAIGLNMVFTDDWRSGVPPYLLVRHLLTRHTTEDALTEIRRIRRASSRYFSIADSTSVIGVEMTSEDFRIVKQQPLVHTNHYLHSRFQESDRLTGPAHFHSRKRLQRLTELLRGGSSVKDILRDHEGYPRSICAHSMGDRTITDTVGAVMMFPGKREMHVVVGHPCENAFRRYSFVESCQNVV